MPAGSISSSRDAVGETIVSACIQGQPSAPHHILHVSACMRTSRSEACVDWRALIRIALRHNSQPVRNANSINVYVSIIQLDNRLTESLR